MTAMAIMAEIRRRSDGNEEGSRKSCSKWGCFFYSGDVCKQLSLLISCA